ncbi:MAG TPA: hypothetical protein PKY82_02690 [Pyrinomonadaceae bacterium]|nr:hypothetical protein [Pyrinomonadaceae bacterium]
MHLFKATFLVFFIFANFSFAFQVDRSKTTFEYRPNVIPVSLQIKKTDDGLWSVSGGVITPVGIFAIEHTFDVKDKFTYLVLRDRAKGTDQVFKIGMTGYVELHTKGEHKLRIQRDDNKVVVDVDTISGSFELLVYPESQAVARVSLGTGEPNIVITSDKRLIVEYESIILNDPSFPLESLESITFRKSFLTRRLYFNWKSGIKDTPPQFFFDFLKRSDAEPGFADLQTAFATYAPNIKFEKSESDSPFYIALAIFLSSLLGAFGFRFWGGSSRYTLNKAGFWDRTFTNKYENEEKLSRRTGCLSVICGIVAVISFLTLACNYLS